MIKANWVDEAAWAIEQKIRHDSLYDGDVARIITDHCPLKLDVAYMPVPRCESCVHFEIDPSYINPSGRCKEASVWSDCNDYTIYVSADFGCVQWKEK